MMEMVTTNREMTKVKTVTTKVTKSLTKTMEMMMGIAMKVAKSQKKIVKMKMKRAAMKVTEMILPTWKTMTHTCKVLMTMTLTK